MRQMSDRHDQRDNESRLQQLERRYRRIQDALTSASASHEALRESPGSSERQLERTRLQVQTLQRQLSQVLESLERAEELQDQDAMA
jgi:F0F1-type ATP synthase membrane subunit b/b'